MADEPSIDEILASLDQLLKEADGRNDDIPDVSGSSDIAAAMPAGAPRVATAHVAGNGLSDSGLTLVGSETSAGPRKLVLSESMLVESPQETLPFEAGGEATTSATGETGADETEADGTKAGETGEDAADTDAPANHETERPEAGATGSDAGRTVGSGLDAAALDALAEAVAKGVSARLARALPPLMAPLLDQWVDQLVREELAARLGSPGGRPDTSETDSGRDDDQEG